MRQVNDGTAERDKRTDNRQAVPDRRIILVYLADALRGSAIPADSLQRAATPVTHLP
jgi:hypothetical protein